MARLSVILKAHEDPHVVSASQMAILAGLSPWMSPLELYLEKVGLSPRDDSSGEAAYWGSKLEPLLLAEYARRNSVYVLGQDDHERPVVFTPKGQIFGRRTKFYKEWVPEDIERLITHTVRHPTLPIITHLDGVTLLAPGQIGGLVQAKTGGYWKRGDWGEQDTDQMPPAYLLQIQTEMWVAGHVTGLKLQDSVPVLLGGQEYRQYVATLNERVGNLIAMLATDFVRRVEEEDPPPPNPDKAGTKALQVLHPGETEELVAEAGTKLLNVAMAARQARLDLKEAEDRYAAAAVALQEMMGNATKLVAPHVTVTWSASKPRDYTAWKGLAEEVLATIPEDERNKWMGRFTTTKPSTRTFKVTPKELEDDE